MPIVNNITKPIIKSALLINQTIAKAATPAPTGFFNIMWGSVHMWIYLFIIASMLMLAGVMLYVFREWFNLKWLELTKPHKLLKILIHYPGGMVTKHYRPIPLRHKFEMGSENYYFDKAAIAKYQLQDPDLEHEHFKFIVDGKAYEYESSLRIKYRWDSYPELHYFYGNPYPVNWSQSYEAGKLNSVEDSDMDASNLFTKLLTYSETKQTLEILMILIGICLLITIVNSLKLFNVIK